MRAVLCISFKVLTVVSLAALVAGCGGGGGGDSSPPPPAATQGTISGSVAGTTVIAVNDSGDIVASDDTTGKTADASGNFPFTLSGLPLNTNLKFYLITGAGTFPLYFDSDNNGSADANVLQVSATAIDLGFVAITGPNAVPANNPLSQGATSGGASANVPPTAQLIGTWGFGVLNHFNTGNVMSRWGTKTYNADGTGSVARTENFNGTTTSTTASFTYTTAISNGRITTTEDGIARTFAISDNGRVMIMDGTDNTANQRFFVAVKMDPNKLYSNADFTDDYFTTGYAIYKIGGPTETDALAGVVTADGAGAASAIYTENDNGAVGPEQAGSGTYTVNANGSFTASDSASFLAGGFFSGNGALAVMATDTKTVDWGIGFLSKRADKTYSTADLAGKWAFVALADDNLVGGGKSFSAAFGTVTCDTLGQCDVAMTTNTDGAIGTDTDSFSAVVSADGSMGGSDISGPSSPFYAAAIGDGGNVIYTGYSFEEAEMREIGVAVRCSAC